MKALRHCAAAHSSLLVIFASSCLALLPQWAWSADCQIDTTKQVTIPAHKTKENPNDQPKHGYRLSDGSIVFLGSLGVDADGAPKAYGPHDSGLDNIANAGSPGDWYGLATDGPNCEGSGTPLVQGPSDPAPGFYVSTTTLSDPAVNDCRKQRNYIDATSIPYVALSPLMAKVDQHEHTGKLVVVSKIAGGMPQPAIQADHAPGYGIGEASIELVQRLGLNANPRSGGSDVREFVYIVMPDRSGFPHAAKEVEDKAGTAFKWWGGEARLQTCKQGLLMAPR
jgi:hypothetical protein